MSASGSLEVLVLCASPVGDLVTLKLPQELIKIEARLRKAQVPVRMTRVFPPTIQQLRHELTAMSQRGDQPGIFHFLGHGDDDGLYFEDELGASQLVKGSELKAALQESPVKLVLLNACWSATKRGVSLVEFLTRERVTETAIGHEVPVADVSAIQFAERFYELVVSGKTLKQACDQARNSLAESGLPGAADVKLVGDSELKLTSDLPVGQHAFVSDDGLPTIGYLPDASVFFGRQEQLLEIARALSDSNLVAVGVWGLGGIGKTALVLEAARRNAWRYRGTAWVDIREATQKTTVELLRLALGRLSPGANSDDPQHALSQFLKGTPSLIVLDNLEDLPESEVPALARFLKQMPRNGSHVLLTARVPLKPVEEVPDVTSIKLTEGLDGWHGPHYVQYVARQKKCLALQDELRHEHGELETTITGLQGKCVLVSQRLHGHPKMLELAVGLALQGEKRLNDALTSLSEHLEDQIAPLLATSLEALDEDGRKLLPLLVFFPTGRLTPEALHVVHDVAFDIDPRRVADPTPPEDGHDENEKDEDESHQTKLPTPGLVGGTQQLVQAGLLDYDQDADTYSFHQLVADHCPSYTSGVARDSVINRLLGHYLDYFAKYRKYDRMLIRCALETHFYLNQLWYQSPRESEFDELLAFGADILAEHASRIGDTDIEDIWNERATALLRLPLLAHRKSYLMRSMYRLGSRCIRRGQIVEAESLFNEALELVGEPKDAEGCAAIYYALAQLEQARGNIPKAYELALKSDSLELDESQLSNESSANNHLKRTLFLGILEFQLRRISEARIRLESALKRSQAVGDLVCMAHCNRELGSLECKHGDINIGRGLLLEAKTIFEECPRGRQDWTGLSATLNELGLVERHCGNFTEARRYFENAIQIGDSSGDQVRQAESMHELGMLFEAIGDFASASHYLSISADISDKIGDLKGAAASRHRLAVLLLRNGDLDAAHSALLNVESTIRASNDAKDYSDWLHSMATLKLMSRQFQEARTHAEECVSIKRRIQCNDNLSDSLTTLGQIELSENRFREAERLCLEAIEMAKLTGSTPREISARLVLAQVLAKQGEWATTNGELELAIGIASAICPASQQQSHEVFSHIWRTRVHSDLKFFDSYDYESALELISRYRNASVKLIDTARWQLVEGMLAGLNFDLQRFNVIMDELRHAIASDKRLGMPLSVVLEELRSEMEQHIADRPRSQILLASAMDLLEANQAAEALSLLEQAVIEARQDQQALDVATALYCIGQVLLRLGRTSEAVVSLREALEFATASAEEDLANAIQEVLTAAVRLSK